MRMRHRFLHHLTCEYKRNRIAPCADPQHKGPYAMIASVKQGESVSSERYKKKRKRQKKTDDLAYGAGDHMKQGGRKGGWG